MYVCMYVRDWQLTFEEYCILSNVGKLTEEKTSFSFVDVFVKLGIFTYRAYSHDVMAAILVFQTNPVDVVKNFFCSHKFA